MQNSLQSEMTTFLLKKKTVPPTDFLVVMMAAFKRKQQKVFHVGGNLGVLCDGPNYIAGLSVSDTRQIR